MMKSKTDYTLDVRDVDRQAEERKWNYIVPEDWWYRYAIHNIIDESDWLFKDEWDAWMELYDHLICIGAEIKYLPRIEWIKWK